MYRLREAIAGVRQPFVTVGEYVARTDRTSERTAPDVDDYIHVFKVRSLPVQAAQIALEVELLECEAVWGDTLKAAHAELRSCLATLAANVSLFIEHGPHAPASEQLERAEIEATRRVVFDASRLDGPDEYTRSLIRAVRLFEQVLAPHLARK